MMMINDDDDDDDDGDSDSPDRFGNPEVMTVLNWLEYFSMILVLPYLSWPLRWTCMGDM